MLKALRLPRWPGGAEVCVSLTFDVDADCVHLRHGEQSLNRLTSLSSYQYGPNRGVRRILDILKRFEIGATFYVPGDTAERYPGIILEILENGHEIGHHGYLHYHDNELSDIGEREEIERGLAALDRVAGVTPTGYRSPGWELTPSTLGLLCRSGFVYDSSCMGDDRPYLEEAAGFSILELPVHWSLDDVPYYAWTRESGGQMCDPATLWNTWLAEFDSGVEEERHISFTMHPEFVGRGYRARGLSEFIEEMQRRSNVWFATHNEVAELVRASTVSPAQVM